MKEATGVTVPELPEPLLETNGDVFGHENLEGFTADQMREYARAAVLAERERCAKVCEAMKNQGGGRGWNQASDFFAASIREGA